MGKTSMEYFKIIQDNPQIGEIIEALKPAKEKNKYPIYEVAKKHIFPLITCKDNCNVILAEVIKKLKT